MDLFLLVNEDADLTLVTCDRDVTRPHRESNEALSLVSIERPPRWPVGKRRGKAILLGLLCSLVRVESKGSRSAVPF